MAPSLLLMLKIAQLHGKRKACANPVLSSVAFDFSEEGLCDKGGIGNDIVLISVWCEQPE